jgi:hypothetical protein
VVLTNGCRLGNVEGYWGIGAFLPCVLSHLEVESEGRNLFLHPPAAGVGSQNSWVMPWLTRMTRELAVVTLRYLPPWGSLVHTCLWL